MATSASFWTDFGPGDTAGGYELLSARSPNRYHLMRILRKRGMRETGEVLNTLLTDSTPASEASVAVSQVTAAATPGGSNSQGGVRTVAAINLMGSVLDSDKDDASDKTARNVSSADVTTLQKELVASGAQSSRSPTYPTDASGNGGGGKLS